MIQMEEHVEAGSQQVPIVKTAELDQAGEWSRLVSEKMGVKPETSLQRVKITMLLTK